MVDVNQDGADIEAAIAMRVLNEELLPSFDNCVDSSDYW